VIEQTKRHAYISWLLGIPHIVVAINKMDLVDWAEDTFDRICRDFCEFARLLPFKDASFIPICALHGDNVVDRSQNMSWYGGQPLLDHLETVEIAQDRNLTDIRVPVQWVIRTGGDGTGEHHDYRGYAGQIAGGILRPGDEVVVLPSGARTTIAAIDTADGPLDEAFPPMSVTLRLNDNIDVSRGDLICGTKNQPTLARELEANICWMAQTPLHPGGRYAIKHATFTATAIIDAIDTRVDVHTLQPRPNPPELALNDIGRVRLRTSKPMAFDPYTHNRATGSFILIDQATNDTVAAGMIV
jgi:sulfate adenylyltransferase large subunit